MMTTEERIKIIESTNSFDEIPLDVLPPSHKENYYFVSYSHKDYKRVFADILRLEALGINIWYDNEMHIGENWREIAQLYISKFQCAGIIFYLTEHSISSPACNQEVEYVLTHNKNFLSINQPLEGCGVQSGYGMLKELQKRGLQCSPSLLENFQKAFSDEVLYLGIDEKIERKAQQISSIQREPLLRLEKREDWHTKQEELAVIACRDNTLIQVDLSKIHEADGFSGNVAAIDDCVFTNSIKLQSVKLSDRLHKIGESAFRNCDSLEEIDFTSLRDLEIGKSAFKGCSKLKSVDLSHAKKVDEDAFSECEQLTVATLNGEIGRNAFYKTSIENVDYIAESPYLRDGAFWCTKSLRTFRIQGKFTNDLGDSAFYGCENLQEAGPFVAPWTLFNENERMLKIGAYAFNACDALESVRFVGAWDTSTAIGAFWSCRSLREIDLDVKGTVIPSCFARKCERLERVAHSERFTSVGEEAFEGCGMLTAFDLSNAEVVEKGAFADAGLERAYLKSVRQIGKSAFANCKNLQSVYVGKACKRIDSCAFLGCTSLKTLKILSEDVEIKNDFLSYAEVQCLYLSGQKALEALPATVFEQLSVLYLAEGLGEREMEGFDRAESDELGFYKYVARGKEVYIDPEDTLDLTDSELNEADAFSPKYVPPKDARIIEWIGADVLVKHRRLKRARKYFVEELVFTDGGKALDYLTVSVHSGKSFRLDGTLIESVEPTDKTVGAWFFVAEPKSLEERDCCIVGNGEFHYAHVSIVRYNPIPRWNAETGFSYAIESLIYLEDDQMKAISGLDLESITVFNADFEAEATYTRTAKTE